MTLLEHAARKGSLGNRAPLADRMRPRNLDEVLGQTHLLGKDRWLRRAILGDRFPSLILWGPPGTGKTTLASVIAGATARTFVPFSAVLGGVPELRTLLAEAEENLRYRGKGTVLFVDEIHRFNKAQQDAFLPHVERGTVTLIGATTENPSFSVIRAVLSRSVSWRRRSRAFPRAKLVRVPLRRRTRPARQRSRRRRGSRSMCWAICSVTGRCSTTRTATSTTSSRARSSRACAAATPMPPSTT